MTDQRLLLDTAHRSNLPKTFIGYPGEVLTLN